jgi:hypothetical protein
MHKPRGAGLEFFVKEIACFASNVEEAVFAGDTMMYTGGCKQVSV